MNELDLFAAAIAVADPAERAALLDQHCAGQPELRQRLEQLLEAHFRSNPLLDQPQPEPLHTSAYGDPQAAPAGPPRVAEAAGEVIGGKYTLVDLIGEGGMGSVWRARQTEPVKRFVAVKLIKAGMDSKQVLARFDAERQALALMDHPNIARVLDGGLHQQRPFFVMELVKGVPITDFCDARKLTPKERLELFVPVCQAIQHAHQKGIIHRDIKPSNVLIALYDDKPVPKVIDFGVAKATGGTLTERTIDTGFGAVVGTPEYMSPEQATFNNLDIDTRSDVYALGVLLYELLTGSPPFSKKELEKKGLLEMLRVVREEEPPRPSTKLSTADALPTLSANRSTEPKKLTGLLRNELDWIVMKALEKDRTRRYETANGFAADVNRYLAGEAVRAHPPSTAYRLKKFVRKHKEQVLAASVVLFVLLAGLAATAWQAVRAEQARAEEARQRTTAEDKERQATAAEKKEREARLEEERQRKFAEAISGFVIDDFLALTSVEGQDRFGGVGKETLSKDTTLRELLDRAAQKLRERKDLDPRIEAELCWIVGVNYRGAGEAQKGVEFLERTVRLRTELLGRGHQDTLDAMNSLAVAYGAAGKLDLAVPLYEETLKLQKARLGPEHPNTLHIMSNLALAYQEAGKRDLALPLFEETLKLQKARLGPDHPNTLRTMSNLALAYQDAGKLDLALPLIEAALKLQKGKLGPEHPETLRTMNYLAGVSEAAGKLDLAVPLYEETLRLQKAKLGAEHPETLHTMGNLASAYRAAGKLDLAVPLSEETLKVRKATLGPEHPYTLVGMNNLARAYQAVGKVDLALPLVEETLKLRKDTLGLNHPDTLGSMGNLAKAYQAAGKVDLALPLYEETLKLVKATLGPEHPGTLTIMNNLARAYHAAGKVDRALPLLEETLKLQKARLGPDHPHTLNTMNNLAVAYQAAGKLDLAQELLSELRRVLPKNSTQLAGLLAQIGLGLLQQKKWVEAEPLLRECLAIRQKTQPEVWTTFNTQSLLGGALLGQNKYAEAEPLLLKGYEGMRQREKTIPPQSSTRLPEALDRLIELYTATNKPDEVKKWQAERAKYPQTKPADKK
jgi:serine/threonine protein kinase